MPNGASYCSLTFAVLSQSLGSNLIKSTFNGMREAVKYEALNCHTFRLLSQHHIFVLLQVHLTTADDVNVLAEAAETSLAKPVS